MKKASPNVLLIMTDQHHPRFMGCAGESILLTPHLDALAARGARFENAYCTSPLCCPSRMSFMTARYASDIDCLSNHAQLGSDVPTFAHAFNAAGYETVLCGRMHFNGPDQRHGFQKRLVGEVVGAGKDPNAEMTAVLGPGLGRATGPHAFALNKSGAGYSGYQAYDETVTQHAAAWLENKGRSKSKEPFMMVVGYVLPHAPFIATPDDYALYNDRIAIEDLPLPHPEELHPALRALQRSAKLEDAEPVELEAQRRSRVAYYGMCTQVDRNVGRILASLEEAGLTDETIVVYTSDHGEQLGEHGMWWKHTFYEASVGVPLLMAGPGLPRGTFNSNVSLLDLGPTLLDMVGAPSIPGATGQSFRCLFEGHPADWPDTVISENLWSLASPEVQRMVKCGAWKLCHYPGEAPQLFNLAQDPGEYHDRASDPSCREILESLTRQLMADWDYEEIMARRANTIIVEAWTRQWWKECDLPLPDAQWWSEPPLNTLDSGSL